MGSRLLALTLLIILPVPLQAAEPDLEELKKRWSSSADKPVAKRLPLLRDFAQVKSRACVEYLVKLRASEQAPLIKQEALRIIGQIGVDPARATLIQALSSTDVREQSTAASALRAFPKPEVADALVAVLGKEKVSTTVRRACVSTLRGFVKKRLAGWFVDEALSESTPPLALPTLLHLAPSCRDIRQVRVAVTNQLDHSSPAVRAAAADTLGILAEGEGGLAIGSLNALTPLLRDRHETVVLSAGLAIGRIGPQGPSLDAILKLCRSRSPDLRAVAIAALQRASDPRALKAAKKAIQDKAINVRAAAVKALRAMGGKDAISALVDGLKKNPSGRLQAEILTALRRLTGTDRGTRYKQWKRWWSKVKDRYDLTTVKASASKGGATTTRKNPTYYGSEVVSRRVAFIVDCSGSMRAQVKGKELTRTRIQICRQQLAGVIKALPRGTFFNVVRFSGRFKPWSPHLSPANPKQKKSALQFVSKLKASGGTNIFDPLEATLRDPDVDTIYLLSDGAPSAGKVTAPEDILREVKKLNAARQVAIHTISVGRKSKFMKQLAEQNGGTCLNR